MPTGLAGQNVLTGPHDGWLPALPPVMLQSACCDTGASFTNKGTLPRRAIQFSKIKCCVVAASLASLAESISKQFGLSNKK